MFCWLRLHSALDRTIDSIRDALSGFPHLLHVKHLRDPGIVRPDVAMHRVLSHGRPSTLRIHLPRSEWRSTPGSVFIRVEVFTVQRVRDLQSGIPERHRPAHVVDDRREQRCAFNLFPDASAERREAGRRELESQWLGGAAGDIERRGCASDAAGLLCFALLTRQRQAEVRQPINRVDRGNVNS